MAKLIYTDYKHGIRIVLPLAALEFVPSIQIVTNEGYSEVKDLEIDPEFKSSFPLIDSNQIGDASRKERRLKELMDDMTQIQKQIDIETGVKEN